MPCCKASITTRGVGVAERGNARPKLSQLVRPPRRIGRSGIVLSQKRISGVDAEKNGVNWTPADAGELWRLAYAPSAGISAGGQFGIRAPSVLRERNRDR